MCLLQVYVAVCQSFTAMRITYIVVYVMPPPPHTEKTAGPEGRDGEGGYFSISNIESGRNKNPITSLLLTQWVLLYIKCGNTFGMFTSTKQIKSNQSKSNRGKTRRFFSILDKRYLINTPQEFELWSDVECVLFFRCTLLNVFFCYCGYSMV